MRSLIGCALLLGALAAQVPEAAVQDKALAKAQQAVADWLQSGMTDEKDLGKAVKAVLDGGELALPWFGGELAKATDLSDARTKGLQSIATHVCLDFIKRARATDMVFAGQYSPLSPLMPFSGKLMVKLLLDTPDWYPTTFRAQLVPALRDLYPQSPGEDAVQGMLELQKNVEVEPENLRVQLALGLHQWGHPELMQPVIDRWRQASGDGQPSDRVDALRMLADLYYQLRDYPHSAATHRLMEALAKSSDVPLWPTDWYASACVHALSGDAERAIAAFEQCIERQTCGTVDSSLFIKKQVFEKDPEIQSLRGTARFVTAMKRAFPDDAKDGKEKKDEQEKADKKGEAR